MFLVLAQKWCSLKLSRSQSEKNNYLFIPFLFSVVTLCAFKIVKLLINVEVKAGLGNTRRIHIFLFYYLLAYLKCCANVYILWCMVLISKVIASWKFKTVIYGEGDADDLTRLINTRGAYKHTCHTSSLLHPQYNYFQKWFWF